jgi:clan AA aspartic protease (TIGR02281 family)
MKKAAIIIFLIFISHTLFSQTIIKLKRQGGVSIIPCKINGLNLELIFDTGASDVSISLTEASSMLRNGKLTESDILGTANYVDANGDISEGIVVNIKEIEIAGLKMMNIKASVVKNLNAPLLLGQTAISKLGKIQLDLNNNTLTILNGKGTYDYSTYSLTDKIEKYYKDFSVVKIEKKDNTEGISISYTIPKKWKEQKIANTATFKNYLSDEYPYGTMYELKIGLQTLPFLYNTYDSCKDFVDYVNNINKNVDHFLKIVSISETKISFCKTIKNVTLTKDENINKLSIQFCVFVGNKLINLIYSAYTSDLNKLTSISDEFDDFCISQVSNMIVYNALENAATCTIQSNAIENKKEISITLNNSCKWFKAEGDKALNLFNSSTSSTLSLNISDKNDALLDLDLLNPAELLEFKNTVLKDIGNTYQVIKSDIVTLNKKKFIYINTKGKNNDELNFSECYYYIINKRLITIFSFIKDKDEENLNIRFKKTQNDLKDLLNEIEIIGKKIQNPNDYFNNGLAKAQSNDFKGAIIDFNMAIELNPKLAEAFFNRGSAKFRLQDNKGAIDDFTKAIIINPNFEQFYYNRGVVKIQTKDYQGALTDFNKVILMKPNFTDAYLNRGLMKIVLGTKESGCADLNKAKELGSTKSDKAINIYCK